MYVVSTTFGGTQDLTGRAATLRNGRKQIQRAYTVEVEEDEVDG
jgi:hypothetical protein